MATIRSIITDALRLLRLLPGGEIASGTDAVDCLRHFNDMVRSWKAAGTDIMWPAGDDEPIVGYVDLDFDDPWPFGDQYLGGVKALLAVYIAPEYGRVISDQIQLRANDCWAAIQANFQVAQDATSPSALIYMPSTWPYGWSYIDSDPDI